LSLSPSAVESSLARKRPGRFQFANLVSGDGILEEFVSRGVRGGGEVIGLSSKNQNLILVREMYCGGLIDGEKRVAARS